MPDDDPYLALRKRVGLGEAARELLESDIFISVLKQVEDDAIAQWKSARGPSGASTREHAHGVVVGIDAIRGQAQMLVNDGELARSEISQLTDDSEQE